MKRFFLTLAVLLSVGAFVSAQEWLSDYPQALAQAKAQKKAVVIDFTGSDWCTWCMKLDREVFATAEFKNYAAQNLVLLRADFPKRHALPAAQEAHNEKLAARYHVNAFPTVIVLRSDGSKAGELGYQPGGPRPFLRSVEKLTGTR
ncbi:MAG: thioredoxin family protein [Chthoniobacteraceae bacterium]|nr:thioredoxin family protein [Chthoniobacteraceae bacterium]